MTKIISYEPPSSSSTATSNNRKGQPSPAAHLDDKGQPSAAAHLADDRAKVFRHLLVSVIMFASFCFLAANVWTDGGHHHWCNVIVAAIIFLYTTVMIHLLLITSRDRNKKIRDLESCQVIIITTPRDCLTSVLAAVATVIMLISLGVSLFISRPAWSVLASIASVLSVSTGLTLLSLKYEEYERKKKLEEKGENASDLV